MTRTCRILFIGGFSVLALGCAPRHARFTQELRVEQRLTDAEIRRIQFFISNRVVLSREVADTAEKRVTAGHTLFVRNGKEIEEVEIESLTPGLVVRSGPDALDVSFAAGSSMRFTPRVEDGYARGAYALAGRWHWVNGKVDFEGREWDASSTADLLFDEERLNELVLKRRVLPGLHFEPAPLLPPPPAPSAFLDLDLSSLRAL
jgi:hypothetical protein